MNEEYKVKRSITPAMAVKTFKKNGQDITEEQAAEVLELMYFLAELIVKQNPEIFK